MTDINQEITTIELQIERMMLRRQELLSQLKTIPEKPTLAYLLDLFDEGVATPCRTAAIYNERVVFCVLARQITGKSASQIGRAVGRETSTINYALRNATPKQIAKAVRMAEAWKPKEKTHETD